MAARSRMLDLPHRAYIEALADAPEGSPAWHAIVAGYAALQLFESWMDGGVGASAPSMLELRRVRRYLEAVPERHPAHRCLAQLVDSIEASTIEPEFESREAPRTEVGRVLASYAKTLQYEAQWGLAADVHGTIVDFAQRTEDVPLLLDAMLMRGYSLRMQGRLDEASEAYAALRGAAAAAGDVRYQLESRLSDAKVAVDRGNIPLARELMDATIAEARGVGCTSIVAKGLTDRARIAAMQGEYDVSLACSYEAFELAADGVDRERILGNIALTFSQMGLRAAARDATLLVAATTQDRSARLTALVNLMELAYQDGRELVFEQYRRDLAREEMTPYLQAAYLETSTEGFRAFGRENEAHHTAIRLLDVAERHGLNEFVLKADALLQGIDAPVATRAVEAPSPQAETIVRAIAQMRIEAGLPA